MTVVGHVYLQTGNCLKRWDIKDGKESFHSTLSTFSKRVVWFWMVFLTIIHSIVEIFIMHVD